VAPVHWSHEDVNSWLRTAHKGAFASVADRFNNRAHNGRALVRMTEAQLTNIVGVAGPGQANLGSQIYDAIRVQISRVDEYMKQQRQDVRDAAARAKSGRY
jgi:hypothetical protein